jgi:niacin transporter
MNTRKIVLTALFVAIGIVLPQSLHIIGGSNLGAMLLPMHLPVFIGAMLLGPVSGVIIAVVSVLTGMMMGMPPLYIGIYMIFELSVYAIVSGYLYNKLHWNAIIAFVIAKILGMGVSLLIIQFMIGALGVGFPSIFGTFSMFIVSIPGIIIQTILVPSAVILLRKHMNTNESLS